MRCCKKIFAICFVVFTNQFSFSQERALGTWKSFMPYGNSVAMCDAGEKVYCAGPQSIFSYEKSTGTIQVFDKSTGLNDISIKTINYDAITDVLVIAYSNSNLDLIFNGTDIYNIPDIKNKTTGGTVSIYGISFYSGKAYISTDMGISVVDLTRKEISNTYIIGSAGVQIKVFSTSIDGTNIYAATNEGVKYAPLNSTNLQDFNSWILFDSSQNIPSKKAVYVASLNGKVYAVISGGASDTLYEYNGISWTTKWYQTKNTFTGMNLANGNLYFSIYNDDNTTAGKLGKIDAGGNWQVQDAQGQLRPVGWFESGSFSWEADAWWGLFKTNQSNNESIVPDGPYSSSVFAINVNDGVVTVAPGGVDDSWVTVGNDQGFFIYKGDKWQTKNWYSDAAVNGFYDILTVTSIPSIGKTYLGSFFSGIIEYDYVANSCRAITKDNSILEGAVGDTQRTRISAVTTDKHSNLWISNGGALKPIKIVTPQGAWKEYSLPYFYILMKKMVVDQNDQLWAPMKGGSNGLLVWSYNGTLDDESDDKVRLLNVGAGSGGLPDAVVWSVAEDKDGNMWVGTNAGIGVFYCPGSVLTTYGCDADQIKVERDGYVGYLFGTESVRAIAVDAANRKWIGTTTGLWLVSADGKTELLHFTADNSPLPANQITDIAINDATGEVYIGTTAGLVVYQGDAMGECKDCDGALVYPNPVKPDYDGPIAIKGLAENAYVKITDITGTLIYQGKANGTQMIWNGKGYSGTRAKSGVYLVFSSTDLGKEKGVAKILIAN